jgi:hypothetical protein
VAKRERKRTFPESTGMLRSDLGKIEHSQTGSPNASQNPRKPAVWAKIAVRRTQIRAKLKEEETK